MARLGGVAQPEPAMFTPMVRPRILQRIEAAAHYPVILVVAPAGYGKSVAVSQWLEAQLRSQVRFNLQPEHNTLLGFARGFAEAFSSVLPALRNTVASAHQNSASSPTPGIEMARWMASHLEAFEGLIVVDDFHRATEDIHVSRFVAALVAQTTARIQWLISTRSTLDLPVASWLAYRNLDFVIGERDLTFSEEEARELSESAGISEEDLRAVMSVTHGWPVALGFALRDSLSAYGMAGMATATREMLFQYLAEQVYAELLPEERDLLHFVSYLPTANALVLSAAGFAAHLPLLERIRRRATFLTRDESGSYRCHDLFRDFLKSHLERSDPLKASSLQLRGAQAQEAVGNIAAALRLYVDLRASDSVLRLLQARGFELIDRSHGDVVEHAVAALPMEVRLTEPTVLGLRAQREADAGRFDRAETLFRKGIESARSAELQSLLSIRLAILLCNQGRRVNDLLEALMQSDHSTDSMGEITALLAVDYALASDTENAERLMAEAERYCALSDSDEIRAKILLRLGIAGININMPEDWIRNIVQTALGLAQKSETYSIIARVYNVLGTISLFYHYDFSAALRFASLSGAASRKAGDAFALQAALGFQIAANLYSGDLAKLEETLFSCCAVATSDTQRSEAVRLEAQAAVHAWKGEFARALAVMERFAELKYGYYQFDAIFNLAVHSLYAVVADPAHAGRALAAKAIESLKTYRPEHLYAEMLCDHAIVVCAIAEVMAGRNYSAKRILLMNRSRSPSTIALTRVAEVLIHKGQAIERTLPTALDGLARTGHGGLATTLRVCIERWVHDQSSRAHRLGLTTAELDVLAALSRGMKAKDIAATTNRSVHTVRTLIQRAIEKLGCSGQYEALAVAREMGAVPPSNTDA